MMILSTVTEPVADVTIWVMRKAASLLVLVILLAGPVQSLCAQDAVRLSNDSLTALQAYEAQLADLESQYGPYHSNLLEPLESMEALLAEMESYERVAELQRRRLQIRRTEFGFEGGELIPLLEEIITTQLQLSDWQGVADSLDHIRHLHVVNSGRDSEAVLATRRRQAQWLYSRVYLDPDRDRADLVLDARDIYDETLDQAKDKYGEDSPKLIPWLYDRALSLYYLVAMMNTDNGLAGSAIDEVVFRDGVARLHTMSANASIGAISFYGPSSRVPIVDADEPVGVAYLRQARGFINDIEQIGVEINDTELRAMAAIYKGDLNILMRRSSGRKDYREAREWLLEAGIPEERVDSFFARPMPLPMPQFFSDFAGLERYQRSRLSELPGSEDQANHVGLLTVWDEDMRAVAIPRAPEGMAELQIDLNHVDLEFRISTRGEVSSVDVLAAEPDEKKVERTAWRALREISFRPPFIDNRTRTVRDARIRYQFHRREQ